MCCRIIVLLGRLRYDDATYLSSARATLFAKQKTELIFLPLMINNKMTSTRQPPVKRPDEYFKCHPNKTVDMVIFLLCQIEEFKKLDPIETLVLCSNHCDLDTRINLKVKNLSSNIKGTFTRTK